MDDEVRKRKACETCTRAKAKCEPLKTGTGVCHRCDRLKKECVFENSTKRKTPKSRSGPEVFPSWLHWQTNGLRVRKYVPFI
ncbi:hypothetical protein B0J11DRAFT_247426 [Dendryphion nanum]|uniref:Zn(2)-C6 fungal-type domain-containing protein n=1 Tax=Dendryphion nanum TaxID=256645 RepID=A0A9P9E109_9PLEO|nr:hypothetical protein B0J11DRAFT_247426 [Dendryphion nanum]